MISRLAEKTLLKLANGYPALAITGPRQSGKTTLARSLFNHLPYVSMENLDTLELANQDPRGFLSRFESGAVLDEIQRAPELISYLQGVLDESSTMGRFVLTGSQQFGLLSKISQTLAGRIALVELLPFAFREWYAGKRGFTLDEVLFTGLYPAIHDRHLDPQIWYANYVRTYVERDLRQLVNIRDLSNFRRFLKLCAGRNGQLVNLTDIASDCGVSHNTAKAWISILQASYIVFLLQPHFENFNKRLIKSPKLYFYDSGLAAYLLSIQNPDQLNTHPFRGYLYESFIVSEMLKVRFNQGLQGNLYFWRDRSGNEIDVVMDLGDKLQPFELKSGYTVHTDFLKSLQRWTRLAESKAAQPTLIYGGREDYLHHGIKIVSWERWCLEEQYQHSPRTGRS